MTELSKALAATVHVFNALAVLVVVVAAIFAACECGAQCSAWRQEFVQCEEPGCKAGLLDERPPGCWGNW